MNDFHTRMICSQSTSSSKFPNNRGDANNRSQKIKEIIGSRNFIKFFIWKYWFIGDNNIGIFFLSILLVQIAHNCIMSFLYMSL